MKLINTVISSRQNPRTVRSVHQGFFIALIVLFTLSKASAVITTSASTEVPEQNVFVNTISDNAGNLSWNGLGTTIKSGQRNVGQTFLTPGLATESTLLQSVVFRIWEGGANPYVVSPAALEASFTLQIFQVSSATAIPSTSSVPLYVGTGVTPSSLQASDYLSFTLDTPLSLTGGNYYAIQLNWADVAEGRNLSFGQSTQLNYPNGTAFLQQNTQVNGSLVYATHGADLHMMLVTVPEPEVLSLLGLCGGLVLIALRKRRVSLA